MVAVESVLSLTSTQHGILFHCLYHPQDNLYQVQATYEVRGNLDTARLVRAVGDVTRRHALLRSTFHWKQLSQPVQMVRPDPGIEWRELDLSGLEPEQAAQREASFLEYDRATGFDLEAAPAARWGLIRHSATSALLVFTHHHLIVDGWSLAIIMRDLARAYSMQEPLPAGPDFDAFLQWHRQRDVGIERTFWQRRLNEIGSRAGVPIGRFETDEHGKRGHVAVRLETGLVRGLRDLARAVGTSPATVWHAAWSLVLARCGAGSEVVSGAVLAGRPEGLAGVHDIVGMFINTVPLSVPVRDDLTVTQWLRLVDERLAALRPMQFASLAEIKEYASLTGNDELFDNVVVHEGYPTEPAQWPGLTVTEADLIEYPHYPLTLVLRPDPDSQVVLRYDGRRFTSAVAERLLGYYVNALTALAAGCQAVVGEVEILSTSQRAEALAAWVGRPAEQPPRCVPDLIEERIVAAPHALAVVHGGRRISFGELGAMAGRIAGVLQAAGAGRGDIVGVHIGHSPELLAALLAVWRLGAAYLPMDPAQPAQRLRDMLDDAGVKLVISHGNRQWPDSLDAGAVADPVTFSGTEPDAAAYVIYTSGSTGRPNGAVIEHRALANYIAWSVQRYCGRGSGAVLHSSVGFDLTVTTLFAPLAAGQPVLIADSPDELSRVLSTTSGLAFVKLTPSHLEMLAQRPGTRDAAPAAAEWVIGGEALNYSQLEAWLRDAPDAGFVNEYGPTEATVGCCVAWARRDVREGTVAIGQPIPGTYLYVLDDRLQPVPPGVPGELFIGGVCLARGYLGRPALTAAKFLNDPWREGQRMYRTADLVCAGAVGELYYLGRRDDQVKVRGHRVELGEIESALRATGVAHCKVLLRKDPQGNPKLVAYVVGDTAAAREGLRGRLPDYMVPDHLVELDRLPLTVNEKVDTRRLPEPRWQRTRAAGDAPLAGTESELAALWSQVLSLDGIGRDDDFFDLGGHSLTGTRLSAEIDARFQVRMPMSVLFDMRTIARVSSWIDAERLRDRPAPITARTRLLQGSTRS